MYGIVYLIIDGTNDFEYVGQTRCTLGKRFNQHTKNNSYIGNAIRAHGAENFVAAVLKKCASKDELDFWEKHFIKSRDTKYPNGYNLTDGGGSAWEHTPETCAKISAANKGKKRSPEQCANISAAQIKRFKDPAEHAKSSAAKSGEKHPFFGKHHTPQHCANISAALTGKPKSAKHCANLSAACKGKIPSDDTRDKMTAARTGEKNHNYGKPRPKETCAKIGAAQRKESPFKNLTAELDARQLSYAALAKILGINSATVSEKMLCRKNFTARDKATLAEFFGKSAEYLFHTDGDKIYTPTPKRKTSPYPNLIHELDSRQLSYAKLAELMDSDKNTVARKMRGDRSFMQREKEKLAEIFDKPIEYLFARDK